MNDLFFSQNFCYVPAKCSDDFFVVYIQFFTNVYIFSLSGPLPNNLMTFLDISLDIYTYFSEILFLYTAQAPGTRPRATEQYTPALL